MARITDTSNLYKGYVTVSGNYKVGQGNLRVILPQTLRTYAKQRKGLLF